MNKIFILLSLFLSSSTLAVEDMQEGAKNERAIGVTGSTGDQIVSRSGQFRVSGADSLTKGVAILLAEEIKEQLHRLTGEKDKWRVSITVRLHGKRDDVPPPLLHAIRLFEVDGARGLVLDFNLSRGLENGHFDRAVTAALLYERAISEGDEEYLGSNLHVPSWLLEGLREAVSWSQNQGDRRLYEALFKNAGLFKLEELFGVDDEAFDAMDGANKAAFRVSSGALVMALIEQSKGKDGLRIFLNQVAAYEGESPALLRKLFPDLNLSESSLVKWWLLQLANKGGMNLMTDILTIQQTEEGIKKALEIHMPSENGLIEKKDLSAWEELGKLDQNGRTNAIRPAIDSLSRLRYRCFPTCRPLLVGYQSVLSSLAANETKEVAQSLAVLSAERDAISARSARVKDYMDWFEITRARETSGAFDDYQKLKQRLEDNPHRRNDSVSAYLERMNGLFHRECNPK